MRSDLEAAAFAQVHAAQIAELSRRLLAMTDRQKLAIVWQFDVAGDRDSLLCLHVAAAPTCDCQFRYRPCQCARDKAAIRARIDAAKNAGDLATAKQLRRELRAYPRCDCPAMPYRCPHVAEDADALLSDDLLALLSRLLWPDEYDTPPVPAYVLRETDVLEKTAKVGVFIARAARGVGLWHRLDRCRAAAFAWSDRESAEALLAREVHNIRNGHSVAGRIMVQQPQERKRG